jgi:transposase-like protein
MRKIPFGELERVARERCAAVLAAFALLDPSEILSAADLERLVSLGTDLGKRPARGHDDLFHAQIAAGYAEKVRSGSTPIARLARDLKHSRNTVANWVSEARNRDLLSREGPGKSGGQLTDKARQILKEASR